VLSSNPFSSQDERGVEGVVVLDGPKKVLLGHRLSASKTTQSEHADRASMDAVQQEDAEKLKIQAQTKEKSKVQSSIEWLRSGSGSTLPNQVESL